MEVGWPHEKRVRPSHQTSYKVAHGWKETERPTVWKGRELMLEDMYVIIYYLYNWRKRQQGRWRIVVLITKHNILFYFI